MDILKKTSNYKKKGPYIYVAVRRVLAVSPIISYPMLLFNCYHAAIFECTQELLIHYGEEDENKKKKNH